MRERTRDAVLFFACYGALSALVAVFYWYCLTTPLGARVDGAMRGVGLPARIDAITYGLGAAAMFLVGFGRGRDVVRGIVFCFSTLLMSTFVWDNAWVAIQLHRAALGEIVYDLGAPMEIQFVHLLMTVGQYRVFTLAYAGVALVTLLFIRNEVLLVGVGLFVTYVFSSIGIGIFFKLGMTYETVTPRDTMIYLLSNAGIGVVFAAIGLMVWGRGKSGVG